MNNGIFNIIMSTAFAWDNSFYIPLKCKCDLYNFIYCLSILVEPRTIHLRISQSAHRRKFSWILKLHCKTRNNFLLSFKGVGLNSTTQSVLSRPMQRKLVTLVHCQLVEEEGRIRAMRAARSLGERTVTELILQHQNPQQLSSNLWAAVRARGCQFLGPGM